MSWTELADELGRWAGEGRVARLWLRDDDAVAPTAALDRLAGLDLPVLLAVIPAGASAALADRLAGAPRLAPAVHGWAHANHAPPGEKTAELGPHRPLAELLADIRRGRDRLEGLFGSRLVPGLVPPWNRFDARLVPHLAAAGIRALSAFGPPGIARAHGVARIDCQVDLVDWRAGRIGKSAGRVAAELAAALAAARPTGAAVGVLAHHLAHDEAAWTTLAGLVDTVGEHQAAGWVAFADLL